MGVRRPGNIHFAILRYRHRKDGARLSLFVNKKAVLSQGEPCDSAVSLSVTLCNVALRVGVRTGLKGVPACSRPFDPSDTVAVVCIVY